MRLITGCSSGFGRALAEAVVARGDRLVATTRDPAAPTHGAGSRPGGPPVRGRRRAEGPRGSLAQAVLAVAAPAKTVTGTPLRRPLSACAR